MEKLQVYILVCAVVPETAWSVRLGGECDGSAFLHYSSQTLYVKPGDERDLVDKVNDIKETYKTNGMIVHSSEVVNLGMRERVDKSLVDRAAVFKQEQKVAKAREQLELEKEELGKMLALSYNPS